METLSAPALSKRLTSSTLRTPPPTVRGMNTCAATSSTACRMRSRSSELAVMSRNVSSSAPRSEEHTSELQSQSNLVCRLLLEKKKTTHTTHHAASLTCIFPSDRVLHIA